MQVGGDRQTSTSDVCFSKIISLCIRVVHGRRHVLRYSHLPLKWLVRGVSGCERASALFAVNAELVWGRGPATEERLHQVMSIQRRNSGRKRDRGHARAIARWLERHSLAQIGPVSGERVRIRRQFHVLRRQHCRGSARLGVVEGIEVHEVGPPLHQDAGSLLDRSSIVFLPKQRRYFKCLVEVGQLELLNVIKLRACFDENLASLPQLDDSGRHEFRWSRDFQLLIVRESSFDLVALARVELKRAPMRRFKLPLLHLPHVSNLLELVRVNEAIEPLLAFGLEFHPAPALRLETSPNFAWVLTI